MKKLVWCIAVVMATGCGEENAGNPDTSPLSETSTGKTNSPEGEILFEANYRCPAVIEGEFYEDESGFKTLSDTGFTGEVFKAVRNGSLQVYDDNMKPLSADEARERLKYYKTSHVEVEPGIFNEVGDTMNFGPHQVVEILTRETWKLEKDSYALRKDVEAYAPVVSTFDASGNQRGKKILFWIRNPE